MKSREYHERVSPVCATSRGRGTFPLSDGVLACFKFVASYFTIEITVNNRTDEEFLLWFLLLVRFYLNTSS